MAPAPGVALRRRHADRQPRGPHVSGPPHPARSRSDRRRGHPPDLPAARALRHPQVAGQPARAQRGARSAAADRKAARGGAHRACLRCRARRASPTRAPGLVQAAREHGLRSSRSRGRAPSRPRCRCPASRAASSCSWASRPRAAPTAGGSSGWPAEPRAVVFFEAPHRIDRTLAEAGIFWSIDKYIFIREITKINEEFVIRPY